MVAQASVLRTRRRILVIGSGDVARRALARLAPRIAQGRLRVLALTRSEAGAATLRAVGATPLLGDLDARATLLRLAGVAPVVLHLAPPPERGALDTRMRRLLAALARRELPRRLVYVSTTGVYGDCAGAAIDETRAPAPTTARARRRVDAEARLKAFARRTGARAVILRAPGIYADDRLPRERLQRGDPVLVANEDVYTNHIHAEDLARLLLVAVTRGTHRTFNACDDSVLAMGDYFDQVADALALPRPPRLPRAALAQRLTPLTLSFMAESRRLINTRVKRELRFRFDYPTTADGLAAARSHFSGKPLP